jgi:hypothetical protein
MNEATAGIKAVEGQSVTTQFFSCQTMNMKTIVQIATALFILALQTPPAIGQNCPDFSKAVGATMAANDVLDAQLARIKAAGQAPHFDAGVCNAATKLKDLAGAATKLSGQNCGSNTDQLVSALNEMNQGADSEIKLFCTREADLFSPTPTAAA